MKYLDEFRNPKLAKKLLDEIHKMTTKHWSIMEICGGQTHSIIRNGIDQLIPENIELIHGPGCPVCVTPLEMIDRALAIASRPDVILCSFGDMLRVRAAKKTYLQLKVKGLMFGLFIRRLMLSKLPVKTLIKKLFSSVLVLKQPLR